jgi:hypothetical protein
MLYEPEAIGLKAYAPVGDRRGYNRQAQELRQKILV